MGLDELRDRAEIVDVCVRKHWYVDHKQWDELDTVLDEVVSMPTLAEIATDPDFSEDTYLDRYPRTRDDLERGIDAALDGLTTQHLVAGHQVVLDGDRAVCRAHSINVHVPIGAGSDAIVVHGNEYRFDLVRTSLGWRICGMLPTVRWAYGDERHHDVVAKQQAWLDSMAPSGPGSG